jgi:DNA polymerase I-like protein with 3'-5' exonuclease and polymerase domains
MAWAYRQLREYGDTVRFLLQIHDELILEGMEGMEDIVDPIMVEALTKHGAKLVVPVKSSGSFAYRWGELK